jgi:murein DD-endopeptidase MepM/ murein hydrolase activator NlpD
VKQVLCSAAVGAALCLLFLARAAWQHEWNEPARSAQPAAAQVPPGPAARPDLASSDLERLRARELKIPVEGVSAKDLRDNFAEPRGAHAHEALDIPAPRGTPVLAVDDGRVAKLFTSVRGGLTVYQFDPTETFCYYYAHLDRYAPGLQEGTSLRKGALVGYVGTTGNAPPDTPHLHFTVFKLGPEKRWWEGTAINPFPVWVFSD